MIVTKKQYICDISGMRSESKDDFVELSLYSGREYDGCHQNVDVYKTFHIHKSIFDSKIGIKPTDYMKQMELSEELEKLKFEMRKKHELW